MESTFVWVEETLGGKSISYIRLTANMVILHKKDGAMQEIDSNQYFYVALQQLYY